MAKDSKAVKLEIAGELLKLEAIRPNSYRGTYADRAALESIRIAHDQLLDDGGSNICAA